MSSDNALTGTKSEGTVTPAAPTMDSPLAFLTDAGAFNHLWRVATAYAQSQIVPRQFQGKTSDCFIMCQLALRLRVDPFMLLQCSYIVHGRPAFEAKLAIAMLNASGKIRGTIKTVFTGKRGSDDYGAQAWCIDAATGEKVEGPKVDWTMVKGEGWNKDKPLRDGQGVQKSKWNTMPDLMFVYRAAAFLVRTQYPEVLMGMATKEELDDIEPDRGQAVLANQDRLELLMRGESDANGADSTADQVVDATSHPTPLDACTTPPEPAKSTEAPNPRSAAETPPAAAAEPHRGERTVKTLPEAERIDAWRRQVAGCQDVDQLDAWEPGIPDDISPDGQASIRKLLGDRRAIIRAVQPTAQGAPQKARRPRGTNPMFEKGSPCPE